MKQGSNQRFRNTMSCHSNRKTSGEHNYTVAYLQVSQMYPNIRQEFLTNLSSKKRRITLQICTNIFSTSILLKNEDYEEVEHGMQLQQILDYKYMVLSVFVNYTARKYRCVCPAQFWPPWRPNCAVVHFKTFQANTYHAATHSNDPYVCSYTI